MTTIADDTLETTNDESSLGELQPGSPVEPIRYRYEEFWSRTFYGAIIASAAVAGLVILVMWL